MAFSNDPEPSEDWNAAFGKVMAAFKGSEVEVLYAMPEEKTITLASGQTIDIDPIRTQKNMGYAAFENGKAPVYLGDHAGFFDPEAPNPIARAKAYFEK